MKKISLYSILMLSCVVVLNISYAKELLEVDFDTSMGIKERDRYNLMLRDGERSKKH